LPRTEKDTDVKILKATPALLISLSLAACSGGSGDSSSGGTGTDTTPTVSRIFDISLPDDLSNLPQTAQDTLTEFDSRNQMAVATSPTGESVYSGRTAMEVGDLETDGALVEGEVILFVDFASSQLSGQLQGLTLNDLQGNTETVDVIRIEGTNIDAGRYATTLSTDPFTIAGGTANEREGTADAKVDGAFVDGGAGTIGVIEGTVTVGSDPAESLVGVYTADSN